MRDFNTYFNLLEICIVIKGQGKKKKVEGGMKEHMEQQIKLIRVLNFSYQLLILLNRQNREGLKVTWEYVEHKKQTPSGCSFIFILFIYTVGVFA